MALWFKIYTKPLSAIAWKHHVNIHLYADDNQLNIPFNPEESTTAMVRLEACIEDKMLWIRGNGLMLNKEKSEFMFLGSSTDIYKVTD